MPSSFTRDFEAFLRNQEQSGQFSLADVSQELFSVAKEIGTLTGKFNPVEIYTPTLESIQNAKKNVFDAYREQKGMEPDLEPTFEYAYAREAAPAATQAKQRLSALLKIVVAHRPKREADRLYRVALHSKIQDDIALCDLIAGLAHADESLIKTALNRLYAPLEPEMRVRIETGELEKIAQEKAVKTNIVILQEEQRNLLSVMQLNAEQMKKGYTFVLNRNGLLYDEEKNPDGFKVIVDEKAGVIDARHRSRYGRAIVIPGDATETALDFLAYLRHEVEGHVRQSANGERIFGLAGGPLALADETAYEGFATRLEGDFNAELGVHDESVWYAKQFIPAIDAAESGKSFRQIFEQMVQWQWKQHGKGEKPIPKEMPEDILQKAWIATYSVMRGHTDMTNSKGFANRKNFAYAVGNLLDHDMEERGLGFYNEAGILGKHALQFAGRIALKPEDIVYKDCHATREYLALLLQEHGPGSDGAGRFASARR